MSVAYSDAINGTKDVAIAAAMEHANRVRLRELEVDIMAENGNKTGYSIVWECVCVCVCVDDHRLHSTANTVCRC